MKNILDVACGGKMFYFDKNDPRVLFCDIRNIPKQKIANCTSFEIKPDIQCDFTELPFEDRRFRLVIFDPPHLWNTGSRSDLAIKYGKLPADWRNMIRRGFAECFRVLEPGGVLIFKWSETDIKVAEILKLTEEKPLIGHKSGRANKTHWICFVKEVLNA